MVIVLVSLSGRFPERAGTTSHVAGTNTLYGRLSI
jgi:hypothetical protein